MTSEKSQVVPKSLLLAVQSQLRSGGDRLVLVESCTAGLAAGLLGGLPGISENWCGSLVVYRNASKSDWLGLDSKMLDDPAIGPVGSIASAALAKAALQRTPEATVAAAVTGHLGPHSPLGLDGRVFICVARRNGMELIDYAWSCTLKSPSPVDSLDMDRRVSRQSEAAFVFLETIAEHLGDKLNAS